MLGTRFWSKVDKSGDCWVWTAGKTTGGYGVFDLDGSSQYAHRVSYENHYGRVPAGLLVCHTCDVRLCVNPLHLFAGTEQDNMDDMRAKGRSRAVSGEQHYASKLVSEEVRAIRASTLPVAELAQQYGVSKSAVYKIIRNQSWKTLDTVQELS